MGNNTNPYIKRQLAIATAIASYVGTMHIFYFSVDSNGHAGCFNQRGATEHAVSQTHPSKY